MERHLTIGERPNRLAVFANISDKHDMFAIFIEFVWLLARSRAAAELTKMQREGLLLLQRNILIPQHNDGVIVKRRLNLVEHFCGECLAKVDASNLRADGI